MTYREEMGRLAEALHELITDGATVPAADVAAAMSGHAALVATVTQIHADLTQSAHQPRARTLADVERHPVGALARLLKEQPSVSDQAFTDVLQSPAASTAGKLWREVAKSATLAQYEWQRTALVARPAGDTAWSEIADLASLSEAIAVLDDDLADSLSAAGRIPEASAFRHAGRSGLHLAAREAQRIAAGGPLPKNPDLIPIPPTKLLTRLSPSDLPEALARLGRMITTSTNLPPANAAAISQAIAESAMAAAAALDVTGDPTGSASLRDHAVLLADASTLTRRLVALGPDDGNAATQAQIIHDVLVREHRKGTHLTPDVADAVTRAIPQLTTDLAAAVEHQVTTGRWLVPMQGTTHLQWGPVQLLSEKPRMLQALFRADQHSQHLRLPPTLSSDTQVPNLRQVLTKALGSRVSPRPPTPGHPAQAPHPRR